jgi:3',5'-cyclic AMP phosphodiesterase CpdA
MELIRILHASDLHIAKRANVISGLDRISAGISLRPPLLRAVFKTAFFSSYSPTVLLAFSQFVYEDYERSHRKQVDAPIDAIVLTGDIATSGRSKDLKRALWFFQDKPDSNMQAKSTRGGLYATLATVLDTPHLVGPIAIPLLLVPGNHDRLQPSLKGLYLDYWPGGKNFDQVLQGYWDPTLNALDYGPDVKALTLQKNKLTVSIIAADFNLKQSGDRVGLWFNRYAQGRVYQNATNKQDILGNLRQATQDIKRSDPDSVIIWAVHFPPGFPGISSTMELINDNDLINVANGEDILAILSGHTHIPVRYRTPVMKFDVFCAGSATQFYAPLGNHFQILEIEGTNKKDASARLVNYKFDKQQVKFIKE